MIPTFKELANSANILKSTSKDLIRKKLIPAQSMIYLQDKDMLKSASWNYAIEPIKTWGCPVCGLSIKCPKKWIIQHIKIHERNPDARKENEYFESKVNPYFY